MRESAKYTQQTHTGSNPQTSDSSFVTTIHVSAQVQQIRHDIHMTILTSYVKWCFDVSIGFIDITTDDIGFFEFVGGGGQFDNLFDEKL